MALVTSGKGALGRSQLHRRFLVRRDTPLASVPLRYPMAMFLLAGLIIRWPWLSGRLTIPWDAKAHFLPQIQFLASSLANGESPFWTPFVFSGHPQIADPQAMIFSLPFLALAVIEGTPGAWAVDTTVFATLFLSGAALMLWFRDRDWHWGGGLIAALVFTCGASMAWRIQHTGQVLSLSYVPLALLTLDRALARSSLAYGIAAGVVTGCMILGRDQVALLSIYFLAALILWRILASDSPTDAARSALLPIGTAVIVALAVCVIPLTLTMMLAEQSNRPSIGYEDAARGSLHPMLLLTLVIPNVFGAAGRMEDYWGPPSFAWPDTGLFIAQNMGVLYIGAIPLLLVLLAALRGDLWRREIRFIACAAAVALLYGLGLYTPVFRVLYSLLPGVSLFRRPADATFLLGGLGAILAGYAAHRLIVDRFSFFERSQVVAGAGGIAALSILAIGLGWWLDHLSRLVLPFATTIAFFGAGAVTLVWASRYVARKPMLVVFGLAMFITADLAINNGPSSATGLPAAAYDVLEPTTTNATIAILKSRVVQHEMRRDRIELTGLGFHWPNASLTHELENVLGYNPVRLALYSAATGAEDHVGLPEQRQFTALFPSYRSTLANLLGLRFIVTGVPIESIDKHLEPGELPLVAQTKDGYIYENPEAMNRVTFATQARAADFERMIRDGSWPDVDLRSTVLLEHVSKGSQERRPGKTRILHYDNTKILLQADSPDGGWIVLNDIWHPWWRADVDGAPAEILRANVLFRAVAVEPGTHLVRFTFRPGASAMAALGNLFAAFRTHP